MESFETLEKRCYKQLAVVDVIIKPVKFFLILSLVSTLAAFFSGTMNDPIIHWVVIKFHIITLVLIIGSSIPLWMATRTVKKMAQHIK